MNARFPQALLVDIDNTVYAYEPCHAAGLKAAFEEARVVGLWDREDEFVEAYDAARRGVKSRIDAHAAAHSRLLYFKGMIEARLGCTDFDRLRRIEGAYWDGYASQLQPEPHCARVLQQALRDGVRLAWITNFTTERQIWKLTLLGLAGIEALLVTSEEAGADKPNPAIVDLALERLGIANHSAWVIGDEAADAEVARLRGLRALILGQTVRDWREIEEALADARNRRAA